MSLTGRIENRIFVIGAGCTRAFCPTAPLMAGFLKDHGDLLADRRFAPVCDFIAESKMEAASLNIETLFTLASIEKPWLGDRERAEIALVAETTRTLIVEVLHHSLSGSVDSDSGPNGKWIFKLDDVCEDAIRNFSRLLVRDGLSHVMTFNYDPLLENFISREESALQTERIAKNPNDHHLPRFDICYSYGFEGPWFSPQGDMIIQARLRRPADLMWFLKMHGSSRWFARLRAGLPAFPEDILVLPCDDKIADFDYYDAMFEAVPFVVPPLLDKTTVLKNPVINLIWARATKLIQSAEEIVFIGYSLPPTDYYTEFLFRRFTPPHATIMVVDFVDRSWPAEEQLARENAVKSRYGEIFHGCRSVSFNFDGAVEYCRGLSVPAI